jgi:hypothetical protein
MSPRSAVAVICIIVSALACAGADCAETPNSRSESQAQPTGPSHELPPGFPTYAPTPPWKTVLWTVAQNAGDAAGFAREMLYNANPPFRAVETESMQYAESTVGAARELVSYTREDVMTWEIADSTPAVIFVARGTFECFPNRFSEAPRTQSTTMWVIVALGEKGTRAGCSNEVYDLSGLGEVRDVPLPLAPFPTPVSLGAAAG